MNQLGKPLKPKKWHRLHYNAVAKEIRELFPTEWGMDSDINSTAELKQREKANLQRAVLADLAISFAKRFKRDSDEAVNDYEFDPLAFLDQCSPNVDLYPLSELWDVEE